MITDTARQVQRYIEIRLRHYWLKKYGAYQAGQEDTARFLASRLIATETPVPQAVRAAFQYYLEHVQARDFGNVYLYRIPLQSPVVYMVYVTTDGDDGWIELYDEGGTALGSARRYLELVEWGDTATFRAQTDTGDFPPALEARKPNTLWGK